MPNTYHLPQDAAVRIAQQRAWDGLVASISFDNDYDTYESAFSTVYFNGHRVGYVEIVDGQYGDVWEARDLDGNVVTVEVARIDAAAVLVDAFKVSQAPACIVIPGVDGPTLWDCPCRECRRIVRQAGPQE